MKIIERIKDCIRLIKSIWKDDDNRKGFIELYDMIQTAADKKLCIDVVKWVHDAEYAVVVARNANNEYLYESNDYGYDTDFRNKCKYEIQKDLFEHVGQEQYQEQLNVFEPDLALAFKELQYENARANYNEKMVEYMKSLNDIHGKKSNQLMRMWNEICELDELYKEAEINLNS